MSENRSMDEIDKSINDLNKEINNLDKSKSKSWIQYTPDRLDMYAIYAPEPDEKTLTFLIRQLPDYENLQPHERTLKALVQYRWLFAKEMDRQRNLYKS